MRLKVLEIIALISKTMQNCLFCLFPFSIRNSIHFIWPCYLSNAIVILIKSNKNCLFHKFFPCHSLIFSEIHKGLWAIWCFVVVERTQTLGQRNLGSDIKFDLTDHMASDKYFNFSEAQFFSSVKCNNADCCEV